MAATLPASLPCRLVTPLRVLLASTWSLNLRMAGIFFQCERLRAKDNQSGGPRATGQTSRMRDLHDLAFAGLVGHGPFWALPDIPS